MLIRAGRVAMIGPIRQEILSGVRTAAAFETLRDRLSAFPDESLEAADTKAGSKIQAAIRDACRDAERHGRVQRRDAFYWRSDGDCRVRSRAGTGISGDRIAPEEFVQAVTLVLGRGDALQRPALITETRAFLGYNRTGPVLEEAIGRALDALVV